MLPLGLLALWFSTLPVHAGSVTLNGTEWTLSVSSPVNNGSGVDTLSVTLKGDTANYTGTGTLISNVAIKISDSEWTLSVSSPVNNGSGVDTLSVTLKGDTANYTGTGTLISNVAIKISDSIINDVALISASGGTNWTYLSGGLNSKGCSGKGEGWGCFDFNDPNDPLVFGADILGGVAWQFQVDIPEGTLLSELEFKVDYRNFDGSKNGIDGAYVSVPEPSTLFLLLSGTGVLAGAARFRKKT